MDVMFQVGAGVVAPAQINAMSMRETAIAIPIALEIWNVELTIVTQLKDSQLAMTAVMILPHKVKKQSFQLVNISLFL